MNLIGALLTLAILPERHSLQLPPSITYFLIVQERLKAGFDIYCTSNQDGTGSCNRIDNGQAVDCLIVPGGVISCKEEGESTIQCTLTTAILDSQAYFYCTRRTDPGIRNNRINPDRFSPVPAPTNKIFPPIRNPIQNPFDDPFN